MFYLDYKSPTQSLRINGFQSESFPEDESALQATLNDISFHAAVTSPEDTIEKCKALFMSVA